MLNALLSLGRIPRPEGVFNTTLSILAYTRRQYFTGNVVPNPCSPPNTSLARRIISFAAGLCFLLPSAALAEGKVVTGLVGDGPGHVTISGSVARPGSYAMKPGDKLSNLIERAGGLTTDAYPLGAVFAREAVRRQQQAAQDALVAGLELSLGGVLKRRPPAYGLYKDLRWAVESVRQAIVQLQATKPVGRLAVEADPLALKVRPALDTLLQSGDSLWIPSRPDHVMVIGAVYNPGAQHFNSSLTAEQYIKSAGGVRRDGDIGRTFVVLPDGTSRQLKVSFWNRSPEYLPPGSQIVVPIEPDPFGLLELGETATRALSLVTALGPGFIETMGLHDPATRTLVEAAVRATEARTLINPNPDQSE